MTSPASTSIGLRRSEWQRIAYWTAPSLFCLIVYFWGLRAWYQQDDFVWLGQRLHIANFHDFLHAVFGPSIHGTFRPFSERLFLLIASVEFGADAFPARLVVFLTMAASLVVLSSVVRRITRSSLAGFLAPIFWVANAALAFPMSWSSSYMYILCGLCMLLAFHCFLSYIETGNVRYNYLQWAVFLFGFGVIETTIVYPAIAAAYAFLCARKHFAKTLPLFAASAAFLVFHTLYVPKEHEGLYSLHFGASLIRSLRTYWKWGLVPDNFLAWYHWQAYPWRVTVLAALFTAALLAYVALAFRRGNRIPLFGLSAFFILLAPVLPLTEHVSYYYLTLPAIGLAVIAASAAAAAVQSGRLAKSATVCVLALFLLVQAPVAAQSCKWWYARSQEVRSMVLGAAAAHRLMPGKTLVLTGVDLMRFAGAFWDHGFETFKTPEVYVDPGEHDALVAAAPGADVDLEPFFLDPADFQRGLLQHRIAVLSVAGEIPVDVTPRFEAIAQASPQLWPHHVDVTSGVSGDCLRGTWFQVDGNHRWMGKRAGMMLASPALPGRQLDLHGYAAAGEFAGGPLSAAVTINGKSAGTLTLTHEGTFDFALPLPADAEGKPGLEIMLEVSRTFRPAGDSRDLGLSFGTFEIR